MFYNIINMKILITSGGTRVPIDSVRSITNMSKGTYGKNLLVECVNELQFRKIPPTGVEIIFLHAKGSAVPEIDLNMDRQVKVTYIEFDTYQDYHDIAVEIVSEDMPSVIVSAAAVSDYTVVGTDAYWELVWSQETMDLISPKDSGKKNPMFDKIGKFNSAPFCSMVVYMDRDSVENKNNKHIISTLKAAKAIYSKA